ncbi:MAG: DUF4190 domain-containing protein [Candidatus Dormibacteraeota bacterium]|nr:DUF4190 domain-containing protein [Candidatus Dormibacteraeota bacterium]
MSVSPPNDSQATLSLILGILGVIICAPLAVVALFIGNASRKRIAASGGALGGSGLATAGFVLGIIGSIELVIGIVAIVVAIIGAAGRAATGG